jgi:hypothetical protein
MNRPRSHTSLLTDRDRMAITQRKKRMRVLDMDEVMELTEQEEEEKMKKRRKSSHSLASSQTTASSTATASATASTTNTAMFSSIEHSAAPYSSGMPATSTAGASSSFIPSGSGSYGLIDGQAHVINSIHTNTLHNNGHTSDYATNTAAGGGGGGGGSSIGGMLPLDTYTDVPLIAHTNH